MTDFESKIEIILSCCPMRMMR